MKAIKSLLTSSLMILLLVMLHIQVVAAEVNVAFFLEWATPSQIAKVEKTYDQAIGESVNWHVFSSGGEMTKAMSEGNIDIALSMGMPPFITAVNSGIPIKMVAVAVVYNANEDCIIRNATGISKENIQELAGKKVAVPLNTTAEFVFRMTMQHLRVDINAMQIMDRAPEDAAFMLLETEVDLACAYGENSLSKMKRVGKPLLTAQEKKAAGISNVGIISATETFIRQKPDALRQFLKVTADAKSKFSRDASNIDLIARDAGLSVEKTKAQMADFYFPSVEEQLSSYFNDDGIVTRLLPFMGKMFATDKTPAKNDYRSAVDTSFLK